MRPLLEVRFPSEVLYLVITSDTVTDYSQVVANASIHPSSSAHAELVLDARSSGRYNNDSEELHVLITCLCQ